MTITSLLFDYPGARLSPVAPTSQSLGHASSAVGRVFDCLPRKPSVGGVDQGQEVLVSRFAHLLYSHLVELDGL